MTTRWDLPLGSPPQVEAIGRNAHGFEPVDRYCLPDLWSLHLYGYEALLKVGDLEMPVRPGYLGLTPPGTTLETRYFGISVHIYAHFRLASEGGQIRRGPVMQDIGDNYDDVYRRLYEVSGALAESPGRVNARLWDLLWEVTTELEPLDRDVTLHPAVRKAMEIISKELSEPLSVESLASEVGVSEGYLARLFQDSFGESTHAYMRRQRLERAAHLLKRSTLPIKAIAHSVGIPDLQHFNKAVRARYGASPRQLRHS